MLFARTLGVALAVALCSQVAGATPPHHDRDSPATARSDILVAQGTSPTPKPASLTGSAAMNALVGNTVVFLPGPDKPNQLAAYFLPDGMFKSFDGTQISVGKWAITNNKLCIADEKGRPSPEECAELVVVDDIVTITVTYSGSGKADVFRGQILKGNPRNM